jgi:hypothetical protein
MSIYIYISHCINLGGKCNSKVELIINLEFTMSADGEQIRAENSNTTAMMEFILLGFSDSPHLQWILFGIFFAHVLDYSDVQQYYNTINKN